MQFDVEVSERGEAHRVAAEAQELVNARAGQMPAPSVMVYQVEDGSHHALLAYRVCAGTTALNALKILLQELQKSSS
jgi:hypothetical protein